MDRFFQWGIHELSPPSPEKKKKKKKKKWQDLRALLHLGRRDDPYSPLNRGKETKEGENKTI